MNDEEKLKESFDFNGSGIKKILQRAKLFTLIRTVTISLFVFVLLFGIILIANAMILNRIADSELLNETLLNSVAWPNTHMTHSQVNDGFLVGEAEYITYRIVGNRPVYDGTHKIKYSIFPIVQGLYGTGRSQPIQIKNESTEIGNKADIATWEWPWVEFSLYSKVGNKEMTFYHPYIEYETYPNDLALMGEIGEDKYIELALSFDRSYTPEEVQRMLPSEVKIAWYWVDTYSKKNLDAMKGRYVEVEFKENGRTATKKTYQKPMVLRAYDVYGMKAITSTGETVEEPWRYFTEAIDMGRNKKSHYQCIFKNILYEVLRNGKEEITKDDIRVIGVVVTGDTASMKLLKNDHVKAATLGIVTDKF